MFRRRHWQKADATIISKTDTDCVVQVRPADGLGFPFNATVAVPDANAIAPVGTVVSVLFDADSHEAKFDPDDPRVNSAGTAVAATPVAPIDPAPAAPATTIISTPTPKTTISFSTRTNIPGFGDLSELINEARADPQAFQAKMLAQAEQMGVHIRPGQPIVIDTRTSPGDPAPAQAGQSEADVIDQLTKLASLHEQGAITDEEFATMKKKILGQ